jgi:hypothetical protein
MLPESERPHPGRSHRRRVDLQDAADNGAIGEHVEVVIVPFAGRAGSRGALEDQIILSMARPISS